MADLAMRRVDLGLFPQFMLVLIQKETTMEHARHDKPQDLEVSVSNKPVLRG